VECVTLSTNAGGCARMCRTETGEDYRQKGGHTIANQRRVSPAPVIDKTRVNNQVRLIKSKEIRVVTDEGQLGIMDIDSALKIAGERDLDLVEIRPQAEPPVCKIMDYRSSNSRKARSSGRPRNNRRLSHSKKSGCAP